VAFGRTALGALLLLPFALRSRALAPLRTHWRWLLVYTGLEIIGPWVLLGHAEIRLTSSTTGLLIAMVPIVAAIIVTATGQDRLGPRRVAGLLIGLAGVALLVGLDVHADDLVAILQILGVVVGYAIGPIIISRQLADLPPIGVITASLLIAAVAYAPFAVVLRPATVSPAAIGSVAVLAVVCTAVAFLVMFALIAEAGPARMTLITYVNPAVAIGLGALVLNEPITTGLLLGFPLIIVGSVLGTWRSSPPEAGLDPQVVATTRQGRR
jgi:drug/metabolite transporter (DMT)-like permease